MLCHGRLGLLLEKQSCIWIEFPIDLFELEGLFLEHPFFVLGSGLHLLQMEILLGIEHGDLITLGRQIIALECIVLNSAKIDLATGFIRSLPLLVCDLKIRHLSRVSILSHLSRDCQIQMSLEIISEFWYILEPSPLSFDGFGKLLLDTEQTEDFGSLCAQIVVDLPTRFSEFLIALLDSV